MEQQSQLPHLDNEDSFQFKRDQPKKKKSSTLWIVLGAIVGLPVALTFAFLMGLGVMEGIGVVPSLQVLPGDKISSGDQALLREKSILEEGENIHWFYSAGLFSIMEDGNILTDRRVISYETREEKLDIYTLDLNEVAEIIRVQKGDAFSDTHLELYNAEGNGLRLYLSAEKGGDQKFMDELLQRTQLTLIEAPLEEEESAAAAPEETAPAANPEPVPAAG